MMSTLAQSSLFSTRHDFRPHLNNSYIYISYIVSSLAFYFTRDYHVGDLLVVMVVSNLYKYRWNQLQQTYFRVTQLCYVVLGVVILSVRVSHAWFVTNRKNLLVIFLYHIKGQPSSFLPPNSGWWATTRSTLNGGLKWPTFFKNCSRRQISACNVWTVRASEEVQLWRIGSRTRAFQRATDEVRTLPLSLPRGGSKSFLNKIQLRLNEVWYKVSLTERFQQQSCSRPKIISLSNGP